MELKCRGAWQILSFTEGTELFQVFKAEGKFQIKKCMGNFENVASLLN